MAPSYCANAGVCAIAGFAIMREVNLRRSKNLLQSKAFSHLYWENKNDVGAVFFSNPLTPAYISDSVFSELKYVVALVSVLAIVVRVLHFPSSIVEKIICSACVFNWWTNH